MKKITSVKSYSYSCSVRKGGMEGGGSHRDCRDTETGRGVGDREREEDWKTEKKHMKRERGRTGPGGQIVASICVEPAGTCLYRTAGSAFPTPPPLPSPYCHECLRWDLGGCNKLHIHIYFVIFTSNVRPHILCCQLKSVLLLNE